MESIENIDVNDVIDPEIEVHQMEGISSMLFGSNNNNAAANMDEEVEKRTSLPNQAQQNSQIHEQSPPQLESQNATASPMECVEERFE